jgi:uncharacterized membrane protein
MIKMMLNYQKNKALYIVITSPLLYLFALTLIVLVVYILEQRVKLRLFSFIPAIVWIYILSMSLAYSGLIVTNEAIESVASLAKKNLLPAMLFLILLQVDIKSFMKLGKKLILAYLLALFSLAFAFILIGILFDFSADEAAAFGALSGSWMGGSANMIAVGSALGVSEEAFGYALIVDSVNYTLWVMLLLFLVPFAKYFNHFTKAKASEMQMSDLACSCTIGPKRYWLLFVLALFVSYVSQFFSWHVTLINQTTSVVIMATLLGVLGSFTPLKTLGGSKELATTMLYFLIAIIGSKALFDSFDGVVYYVLAGASILVVHAMIMVIGAKLLKLDLFSIALASLSNIGGVASAPILAAAYHHSLVGVGVLMAIMGYIVGTFGGLGVGMIMMEIVK